MSSKIKPYETGKSGEKAKNATVLCYSLSRIPALLRAEESSFLIISTITLRSSILTIWRLYMQLTLEVPDAANISQTDAQILFAMKLFEADKLSLGKAAEAAGLSYRAFYELLVRYGIPVVTMTEEDVKWEIAHARISQ
jgi:predicted HTH domain antitoxin